METFRLKNVSGQNYFLSEINRRVNHEAVLVFTKEEIEKCEFLQTLIRSNKFVLADQGIAPEGDLADINFPENEYIVNLDEVHNPFPKTSAPRDVIVDEHPPRNILVDEQPISSIYDEPEDLKKK